MVLFALVIGGIYQDFFTPTEAGGVMKSRKKCKLAIDIYKTAICILLQQIYKNIADLKLEITPPQPIILSLAPKVFMSAIN